MVNHLNCNWIKLILLIPWPRFWIYINSADINIISSSSGCLGWATLCYCGTLWAFHIIILSLHAKLKVSKWWPKVLKVKMNHMTTIYFAWAWKKWYNNRLQFWKARKDLKHGDYIEICIFTAILDVTSDTPSLTKRHSIQLILKIIFINS